MDPLRTRCGYDFSYHNHTLSSPRVRSLTFATQYFSVQQFA